MIAKLRGHVDSMGEDWAIIDVGGVGYRAFCSTRTLGRLLATEEVASLLIEMQVREDQITLYGFIDQGERDWFRLLTTVQGVGAKVALAILSVLSAEQLVQVIGAQDKAMLTRASGVGPKLAARILNELREKAGKIALTPSSTDMKGVETQLEGGEGPDSVLGDAISALVNLGYGRVEAYGAVTQALRSFDETPSVPVLIRAGLKELSTTMKENRQ